MYEKVGSLEIGLKRCTFLSVTCYVRCFEQSIHLDFLYHYCDTIKMFYEDTGWTDYKLFEYIVSIE